MLLVTVDGKGPGTVFKVRDTAARSYQVKGFATGAVPLQHIQIVVNGEVVHTLTASNRETPGNGYESAINDELTLDQSSWVALRCFEDRPDKRIRFAHTAPFYFEVPGKPLRPRRAEIEFLIRRIEGELARNAEVL